MPIRLTTLALFSASSLAFADWTLQDQASPDRPGRSVDFLQDGVVRAKLIYGDGQIKPYLTLQGEEGDNLNAWSAKQTYPHHRGIFIGWNQIRSNLGTFDLWHFNNGGSMTITKLDKLEGGKNSATIVATIAWKGASKDPDGNDLLLTETRQLIVSRPQPHTTQVDAQFTLEAARDLNLGGDLQHAGIHFRASAAVQSRAKDTSYLWNPDLPKGEGKVVSKELQWVRYTFPIGERWYHATELNAPTNPIDELSWRDYGRFGFFFTKALKQGEKCTVHYRFLTELAPARQGQPSPEEIAKSRQDATAEYQAFIKPQPKN